MLLLYLYVRLTLFYVLNISRNHSSNESSITDRVLGKTVNSSLESKPNVVPEARNYEGNLTITTTYALNGCL